MQHSIDSAELLDQVGPQIEGMVHAIESCVHCGFCLAVCPTYLVLGEEMDSPRGRITLMKSALEAELSVAEAMPYIDRCLGCLACVTACPSGVEYEELVVPFRAYAQGFLQRSSMERLQRSCSRRPCPTPGASAWPRNWDAWAVLWEIFCPRKSVPCCPCYPADCPPHAPCLVFILPRGSCAPVWLC